VIDEHLVVCGWLTVTQAVVSDEERTEHEVVVDHHAADQQQKPGQL